MLYKIKNKFKSEDNKRLLSNFLSLSVLKGASFIFPLITLPYLVRVLGVEYFGLLSFAAAIVAYFNIITDYGFNLTATREISIHRNNKSKVIEIFSSVMTIKFILMSLSFVILSIIVLSFEKLSKDWLVYFLTFGVIVGQFLFPIWFFQGIEKMKYITYLNILAKLIFTVAVFIFVQEKSDFYIVPLLTSMGFIISGIWSLFIINKHFNVFYRIQSIERLKYYFIDGWDIFISTFFGNFYRNFNTIALGLFTDNIFVGYYAIAEKLIKVIQALQSVVGTTLFPHFVNKFNGNKNGFFDITKRYIKPIISIYSVVAIITFILAGFITYLINGVYESNIIINIKIMSLVIIIGGLNYYFGVLGLIALNYKKEFSLFVIITGIFNIITSCILIYFFKDIGASISFVLSEIVLLILILRKIKYIKGTL